MGEKPHECNKCDKTFKKKLLLIMTRLTWEINHMSVTNVTRHNEERLLRMFLTITRIGRQEMEIVNNINKLFLIN